MDATGGICLAFAIDSPSFLNSETSRSRASIALLTCRLLSFDGASLAALWLRSYHLEWPDCAQAIAGSRVLIGDLTGDATLIKSALGSQQHWGSATMEGVN